MASSAGRTPCGAAGRTDEAFRLSVSLQVEAGGPGRESEVPVSPQETGAGRTAGVGRSKRRPGCTAAVRLVPDWPLPGCLSAGTRPFLISEKLNSITLTRDTAVLQPVM